MAFEVYQNDEEALDAAFSKDNKESTSQSGSTYWLKKGNTMLRVLPTWKPNGLWYKEFNSHYINREFGSVVCPQQTGQSCPICEHGRALHETGQAELAKEFKPSRKFLCNAFVLSDPNDTKAADGVKAVEFGVKVKRQLLNFDRNKESGWGDITSIASGNNITISKTGEGKTGTEYGVTPFPQKTNVGNDLAHQGIDIRTFTLHDLDAFVNDSIKSYDELSGMIEALTATPGFEAPAPVAAPAMPSAVPAAPAPAMPVAPAPAMPVAPAPAMPQTTGTVVGDVVPVTQTTDVVPGVPGSVTALPIEIEVPDIPAPPKMEG